MTLRPYKSCDAKTIEKWLQDKDVFLKWGGLLIGEYPINAAMIDSKYRSENGGCEEEDNFYPWVFCDDENRVVGQFIMRYMEGNHKCIRFGWVVVDDTIRGKGYGYQMLQAGLRYAFEFLEADKVTLGVFEQNDPAHNCYKRVGFHDVKVAPGEPWNVIEMEITKEEFRKNRKRM